MDRITQMACARAVLEDLCESTKAASPYRRAYTGLARVPRIRSLRQPRSVTGIPRPAADPFGAYGVRQARTMILPRIPRIPGLRGY